MTGQVVLQTLSSNSQLNAFVAGFLLQLLSHLILPIPSVGKTAMWSRSLSVGAMMTSFDVTFRLLFTNNEKQRRRVFCTVASVVMIAGLVGGRE